MEEGKTEERGMGSLPPSEPEDGYDIIFGKIAFWRDESFRTEFLGLGIDFWVV